MFNTMILNEAHEFRNKNYIDKLKYKNGLKVQILPRVASHNEVIIIFKI